MTWTPPPAPPAIVRPATSAPSNESSAPTQGETSPQQQATQQTHYARPVANSRDEYKITLTKGARHASQSSRGNRRKP